eukprot:Rhum_TRINITY_DN1990_c0_g1::Rhum_TRINITY_DN1990_c0_g1_i1::g.5201::m.5201
MDKKKRADNQRKKKMAETTFHTSHSNENGLSHRRSHVQGPHPRRRVVPGGLHRPHLVHRTRRLVRLTAVALRGRQTVPQRRPLRTHNTLLKPDRQEAHRLRKRDGARLARPQPADVALQRVRRQVRPGTRLEAGPAVRRLPPCLRQHGRQRRVSVAAASADAAACVRMCEGERGAHRPARARGRARERQRRPRRRHVPRRHRHRQVAQRRRCVGEVRPREARPGGAVVGQPACPWATAPTAAAATATLGGVGLVPRPPVRAQQTLLPAAVPVARGVACLELRLRQVREGADAELDVCDAVRLHRGAAQQVFLEDGPASEVLLRRLVPLVVRGFEGSPEGLLVHLDVRRRVTCAQRGSGRSHEEADRTHFCGGGGGLPFSGVAPMKYRYCSFY